MTATITTTIKVSTIVNHFFNIFYTLNESKIVQINEKIDNAVNQTTNQTNIISIGSIIFDKLSQKIIAEKIDTKKKIYIYADKNNNIIISNQNETIKDGQ